MTISGPNGTPGLSNYDMLMRRRGTSGDPQADYEWMLQRKIMEISMQRFEWKGFPDEVDVRWLELGLMDNALMVAFMEPTLDKFMVMQGNQAGNVNMLGNPTKFLVYGGMTDTGTWLYQQELGVDECVPIWANYMRAPDKDIITLYASRLAQLDRTIDINTLTARRTKVMRMSENSKLSVENIDRELNKGASAIKVLPQVALNELYDVVDLGTNPDTINTLDILYSRLWGRLMTLLGINNSNGDKKERLVAAEVGGNDDQIATIREANLKPRKIAAEQINKKFGLNVSVDYVTDLKDATNPDKDTDSMGTPGQGEEGAN